MIITAQNEAHARRAAAAAGLDGADTASLEELAVVADLRKFAKYPIYICEAMASGDPHRVAEEYQRLGQVLEPLLQFHVALHSPHAV